MGKHINPRLESDEVIPMATAAYNFFPHTTSKERLFFLMFGSDPLTGLEKLLGDTVRYLGENGGRLDLTVLQNTYQLAAQNVQKAREKAKGKGPSVPLIFQDGKFRMGIQSSQSCNHSLFREKVCLVQSGSRFPKY